jgi:glycosyltransferase involved in cell wall biosynthesis
MAILSVLVCTRDRPASLIRAVRSVLADDSHRTDPCTTLELIVVDQSEGTDTASALNEIGDPRLRYVHSSTRGKGAALNQGLALARGAIVVCTDDDCEVTPGWARGMTAALERRASAAVLFCQVLPTPDYDAASGFIPAYTLESSRTVRSLSFMFGKFGIGAGMAVRADVVRAIGGFDETLGPGGLYPSCDDWDIAMRALLRGWHVHESAELSVLHHGFRTFRDGVQHARRDWLALGAVCAKPLRAGYWSSFTLACWTFGAYAVWPPVRDVLLLRRPRGLTRILSFLEGFASGLRRPVDPVTLRYYGSST